MEVTCAMIASFRSLAEGVPHGHCYSSDQSGGPLAFGAGGGPQAQRGPVKLKLRYPAISSNVPWAGSLELRSGFPTSARTRTFRTDFAVSCD